MNSPSVVSNGADPSYKASDFARKFEAGAERALDAAREQAENIFAKASGVGKRIKHKLEAATDSLGHGETIKLPVAAAGETVEALATQAGEKAHTLSDDAYKTGTEIVKAMAYAYAVARDYIKANPKKSAAMFVAVAAIGVLAYVRRKEKAGKPTEITADKPTEITTDDVGTL